ncbi:hypothetical protein KEJ26_01845 [Candidatus Bathyarchaeota archaeon]|nr:hypothetical protein [Candidatus Bathyarchaeota archaeon]
MEVVSRLRAIIPARYKDRVVSFLQKMGFYSRRRDREEHYWRYGKNGRIHVILKPFRKKHGKLLLKIHLDCFPCIILQYSPTVSNLLRELLKICHIA